MKFVLKMNITELFISYTFIIAYFKELYVYQYAEVQH